MPPVNEGYRAYADFLATATENRRVLIFGDAARYRWLKETFFDKTFPGLYDSPIGGGVSSEQFDADIDAEPVIAENRSGIDHTK
jgi:hypothetical protein